MVYDEATLRSLIGAHVGRTGGLMIALRTIQETFGHIPRAALPVIAHIFNLTQAEVKGVYSFYDDFKVEPVAKTVVKVCQAEACQSVGSHKLTERVSKALGLELGQTSGDRSVALEPVYCLGLCSCGPSMMVDDKLYARAEGKRLDGILASIPKGAH
ncbi:MAG: NAD(P)H-dependent oxidoreductase subunit E [Alphaproteobacteria bacterium]